jgi:hypothetical protein
VNRVRNLPDPFGIRLQEAAEPGIRSSRVQRRQVPDENALELHAIVPAAGGFTRIVEDAVLIGKRRDRRQCDGLRALQEFCIAGLFGSALKPPRITP